MPDQPDQKFLHRSSSRMSSGSTSIQHVAANRVKLWLRGLQWRSSGYGLFRGPRERQSGGVRIEILLVACTTPGFASCISSDDPQPFALSALVEKVKETMTS